MSFAPKKIRYKRTCNEEENDRIIPKKSSGFGASGVPDFSPKNVKSDVSSFSSVIDIFFIASTFEPICVTKG